MDTMAVSGPVIEQEITDAIDKAESLAVSVVSCWETAYLVRRQRLVLPLSFDAWLAAALGDSGVEALPLSCRAAVMAAQLPDHHRDPADRFIIATALTEDCHLASLDGRFPLYEELKSRLLCSDGTA